MSKSVLCLALFLLLVPPQVDLSRHCPLPLRQLPPLRLLFFLRQIAFEQLQANAKVLVILTALRFVSAGFRVQSRR